MAINGITGAIWGAVQETANLIVRSVPIPIPIDGMWTAYRGDVAEPHGKAEESGARLVRAVAQAIGLSRPNAPNRSALAQAAAGASMTSLGPHEQLIRQHAPLFELDAARSLVPGAPNDTPLLVVPSVQRHAGGHLRITYRVLFSHEDGGTPTEKLVERYGRTTDYEVAYVVDVDPRTGRRLAAQYQTVRHQIRQFDGTFVGDRPLLRVSTTNNMFSQQLNAGPVWPGLIVPPMPEGSTAVQVMARYPWTITVAAAELLREGRLDVSDVREHIADLLRRTGRAGAVTVAQPGPTRQPATR